MKRAVLLSAVSAIMCLGLSSHQTNGAVISEFMPNPPGADALTMNVELSGAAGAIFDGWFLSIESDSDANVGLVDRAAPIAGAFDSNGLLVVQIPDLENPSFTAVLTTGFTGVAGTTDLDTNNDGTLDDISSLVVIEDALGVPDSGGDEAFLYGSQLNGADFAYTGDAPGLVFRSNSTGDWFAVNDPAGDQVFDINANPIDPTLFTSDPLSPTFGAVNATAVPEPANYLALALVAGGLAWVGRRRRRPAPAT